MGCNFEMCGCGSDDTHRAPQQKQTEPGENLWEPENLNK